MEVSAFCASCALLDPRGVCVLFVCSASSDLYGSWSSPLRWHWSHWSGQWFSCLLSSICSVSCLQMPTWHTLHQKVTSRQQSWPIATYNLILAQFKYQCIHFSELFVVVWNGDTQQIPWTGVLVGVPWLWNAFFFIFPFFSDLPSWDICFSSILILSQVLFVCSGVDSFTSKPPNPTYDGPHSNLTESIIGLIDILGSVCSLAGWSQLFTCYMASRQSLKRAQLFPVFLNMYYYWLLLVVIVEYCWW